MEQVKVQAGANSQDYKVFNRFYKQPIDSVHLEFLNRVNNPSLGPDNIKEYMQSVKPYFINLYAKFVKIEQEFPSSVDEYRNLPKFKPGGDSCFSSCYNTDFEDGTLDGWYGYYAVNSSPDDTIGPFNITSITGGYCGHVVNAGGPDPNTSNDYQIRITSGGHQDPFLQTYSTYSMAEVSPWGGQHSVMLGDSSRNGQGTAILSQSFQVSPTTSSLTYQYSVFLENPGGHFYYAQPFFSVAVLDQNGDTIPTCGEYQISAQNAHVNHFRGVWYPIEGDSVYWKNWTIVNVPLKKYIGQCVTIVFQSQDCSLGGHFGYAYVDASCSPLQLISSSPNFCGQDSISLSAPPGATSYKWKGPIGKHYKGIRGSDSGQVVYVDSPGVYSVVTIPVTGVTCADTIYDTIGRLPGPFPHPRFKADSVCAGQVMNFTNLSHPDSGLFSWDFYNIGIYNYNNVLYKDTSWTYASAGTYTVKLHQLANGCGLDTLINVHVLAAVAAPTFTISPLCTGDSTLFKTIAANATQFNWNFGDPGSGPLNTSTLQNTGHVYYKAGTYSVTLKALNAGSCAFDTTFKITITATPTPIISGDSLICVNTPDKLSATGGSSYIWNPGNHSGSSVTVTPGGPTVYTVTATTGGCSGIATFKVTTFPPPATSISPSRDTICAGQTLVLTGHGIGVYKWSTGSSASSISVNPSKTTVYHLRDSIQNSVCLDTASAIVVVRKPLTTSISHDTTVCPNQPVVIAVHASGEPIIYNWNTGATTSTIIVSPSVTTTYTTVVSGIYCYHDTLTNTVNVIPLPIPVISGATWECHGKKDSLFVSSSTNPTKYVWDNGKTTTAIVTGPINSDSSFTVTAFNSLGCPVQISYTVNLRIPPAPVANPPAKFCAGQPITLTASATGSNAPFTYTWSTGQTGSSITIDPGPSTDSTFTVYVSNGCIGTATTTASPGFPILSACCSKTIIINNDTTILVASGNSIKYTWVQNPEKGTIICLDPPKCDSVRVIAPVSTTYTVIGTDTLGCQTEQILSITVDVPCYKVIVPNVITPSQPGPLGLNGELYIKTENIDAWAIHIYDRWGKEVFTTTNQYQYWNGDTEGGSKASDGVYFYVIDATCQNATYKQDGFVQLIR